MTRSTLRLAVAIGVQIAIVAGPFSLGTASAQVPTMPLVKVDDAGDYAWARQVIPALFGRKPLGDNEIRLVGDVAGQLGRSSTAKLLMQQPEFIHRWSEFFVDQLRINRDSSEMNSTNPKKYQGAAFQKASAAYADLAAMCDPAQPGNLTAAAALATYIRSHDASGGVWQGQFNMADVVVSSLALDDVSPIYRAYLFALVNQPMHGAQMNERDRRFDIGDTFNNVYLDRSFDCMGCHSSGWSVVKGGWFPRHFPIPGAFEKALFDFDGSDKDSSARAVANGKTDLFTRLAGLDSEIAVHPEELAEDDFFTKNGFLAAKAKDTDFARHCTTGAPLTPWGGFAGNAGCSSCGQFCLLDTRNLTDDEHTCDPWNPPQNPQPGYMCAANTMSVNEFGKNVWHPLLLDANGKGLNAFFGGPLFWNGNNNEVTNMYATPWAMDTLLKQGADNLRSGWLQFDGTTLIDNAPAGVSGADAYAFLLAANITNQVWTEVMGGSLVMPNHFPRNVESRDMLWSLTQRDLLRHGRFSIRDLLLRLVTSPYFNRRAPAQSADPLYEMPKVFDPMVATDPDPPPGTMEPPEGDKEFHNAMTEGVHRYSAFSLLNSMAHALGWPEPRRFPDEAASYPTKEVSLAIGQPYTDDQPGGNGLSLPGLLEWEQQYGLVSDMIGGYLPRGPAGQCLKPDGQTSPDYIEQLAARAIAKNVTYYDAFIALKARLLGEDEIDVILNPGDQQGAPTEESLLDMLAGTANIRTDRVDPFKIETALRRYCAVLVETPQFMLAGTAVTDNPKLPAIALADVCAPLYEGQPNVLDCTHTYQDLCNEMAARGTTPNVSWDCTGDTAIVTQLRIAQINPCLSMPWLCIPVHSPLPAVGQLQPCLIDPQSCRGVGYTDPRGFGSDTMQQVIDPEGSGVGDVFVVWGEDSIVRTAENAYYLPNGQSIPSPLSVGTHLAAGDLVFLGNTGRLEFGNAASFFSSGYAPDPGPMMFWALLVTGPSYMRPPPPPPGPGATAADVSEILAAQGAVRASQLGLCTADINNDPNNCGGCGHTCGMSFYCRRGACTAGDPSLPTRFNVVADPSGDLFAIDLDGMVWAEPRGFGNAWVNAGAPPGDPIRYGSVADQPAGADTKMAFFVGHSGKLWMLEDDSSSTGPALQNLQWSQVPLPASCGAVVDQPAMAGIPGQSSSLVVRCMTGILGELSLPGGGWTMHALPAAASIARSPAVMAAARPALGTVIGAAVFDSSGSLWIGSGTPATDDWVFTAVPLPSGLSFSGNPSYLLDPVSGYRGGLFLGADGQAWELQLPPPSSDPAQPPAAPSWVAHGFPSTEHCARPDGDGFSTALDASYGTWFGVVRCTGFDLDGIGSIAKLQYAAGHWEWDVFTPPAPPRSVGAGVFLYGDPYAQIVTRAAPPPTDGVLPPAMGPCDAAFVAVYDPITQTIAVDEWAGYRGAPYQWAGAGDQPGDAEMMWVHEAPLSVSSPLPQPLVNELLLLRTACWTSWSIRVTAWSPTLAYIADLVSTLSNVRSDPRDAIDELLRATDGSAVCNAASHLFYDLDFPTPVPDPTVHLPNSLASAYSALQTACTSPSWDLSTQASLIATVADGLSQLPNLTNDQLNALYALGHPNTGVGACHAFGWVSFVMFSPSVGPSNNGDQGGPPQAIRDILNGFFNDCQSPSTVSLSDEQAGLTTVVEFVQAGIAANQIDAGFGAQISADLAAMQAATNGTGFCTAGNALRQLVGM